MMAVRSGPASVVAALTAGAIACSPAPVTVPEPVLRLMECFDCLSHELETVVALGPPVVPLLEKLATDGPSRDRLDRLDAAVQALLADTAAGPHPPLTPA